MTSTSNEGPQVNQAEEREGLCEWPDPNSPCSRVAVSPETGKPPPADRSKGGRLPRYCQQGGHTAKAAHKLLQKTQPAAPGPTSTALPDDTTHPVSAAELRAETVLTRFTGMADQLRGELDTAINTLRTLTDERAHSVELASVRADAEKRVAAANSAAATEHELRIKAQNQMQVATAAADEQIAVADAAVAKQNELQDELEQAVARATAAENTTLAAVEAMREANTSRRESAQQLLAEAQTERAGRASAEADRLLAEVRLGESLDNTAVAIQFMNQFELDVAELRIQHDLAVESEKAARKETVETTKRLGTAEEAVRQAREAQETAAAEVSNLRIELADVTAQLSQKSSQIIQLTAENRGFREQLTSQEQSLRTGFEAAISNLQTQLETSHLDERQARDTVVRQSEQLLLLQAELAQLRAERSPSTEGSEGGRTDGDS